MASKKQSTLMIKTHQLLNSSKESVDTIAKETKLTSYWLSRFRRNEFKDPSVNKVQILYEYLTGKKLSI